DDADPTQTPEPGKASGPHPRVVLTIPPDPSAPRRPGTALVAGGTGTLGALVTRHLADSGRAAAFLLTSRSGPVAEGVPALAAAVAARGAGTRVVACDVADRDALAAVLAAVPAELPLSTVVQAAGVVDDALTGDLTAERLAAVARPKSGAAWRLHELTRTADLDGFALFSSLSATVGNAGQGNHCAASAFLDALAEQRCAAGLPGSSMAWGLWADTSKITGTMSAQDLARVARSGVAAMPAEVALALFDAASARPEPVLVTASFNTAALRSAAEADALPPVLRALADAGPRRPARRQAAADSDAGPELRARLGRAGTAEQRTILTELVRSEAAVLLGHASAGEVDLDLSFLEQGLDSLTAVELRNRLHALTGVRLRGSAAFDHPTVPELAARLHSGLGPEVRAPGADTADEPATGTGMASGGASGTGTATFGRLYRQAAADGLTEQAMAVIRGAAAFRPVFTAEDPGAENQRLVGVTQGPDTPSVITFPSFVSRSAIQEYAALAAGFRGVRKVTAAPSPGFAPGEPLAADLAALVGRHAAAVAGTLDGTAFVLAGHSSGGLVAHAVATRLAAEGRAPAGVVLMDTYAPGRPEMAMASWSRLPALLLADADPDEDPVAEDAWLTAMAHYLSLDWNGLEPVSIPTLLVRGRDPLTELGAAPAELSWGLSDDVTVVDVPGNHLTMLSVHAQTTAQAVNDWLDRPRVSSEK
uniref:KR domain-containing protein n=1 Tax=Catenulispora pinisilvae TaxID=2705253 RepID=UPI001891B598